MILYKSEGGSLELHVEQQLYLVRPPCVKLSIGMTITITIGHQLTWATNRRLTASSLDAARSASNWHMISSLAASSVRASLRAISVRSRASVWDCRTSSSATRSSLRKEAFGLQELQRDSLLLSILLSLSISFVLTLLSFSLSPLAPLAPFRLSAKGRRRIDNFLSSSKAHFAFRSSSFTVLRRRSRSARVVKLDIFSADSRCIAVCRSWMVSRLKRWKSLFRTRGALKKQFFQCEHLRITSTSCSNFDPRQVDIIDNYLW